MVAYLYFLVELLSKQILIGYVGSRRVSYINQMTKTFILLYPNIFGVPQPKS